MMDFAVEDITCAACITKIESTLQHMSGVEQARVNYTNRRLHVEWSFGRIDPARFIAELKKSAIAPIRSAPARSKAKKRAR